MKHVGFIVFSVVFWAAGFLVAVFAMIVHGDCYAGTTEAEFRACNRAAAILGLAVIAGAGLLYATLIRHYLRKRSD